MQNKQNKISETTIPGLLEIDLVVHGDDRGWFKENYQKEKMEALGLPQFIPVQNNISFNAEAGVTRGLHAEPWDKLISVANGKVFAVWVDLREGPGFGKTYSAEMTPDKSFYVPRGVANGYQTLEENVSYSYLVNGHWSPEASYTLVSLFDDSLDIKWPILLNQAVISDKDKSHPKLSEVDPIAS